MCVQLLVAWARGDRHGISAERVQMGLSHAGLVLCFVLVLLVGTVMSSSSCGMMCGPLGGVHITGSVGRTTSLVVGTSVTSSGIRCIIG